MDVVSDFQVQEDSWWLAEKKNALKNGKAQLQDPGNIFIDFF